MCKKLFAKELYDYQVIAHCIRDYSSIATIECADKELYWECSFSNCTVDENRVMMEFENYLIGNTNKAGKTI